MPGSVANAAPSTVMPWNLCKAFARANEFDVIENDYADGTSQRSKFATSSRKRWRLAHRLTAANLATLRTFYENRKGPHEPFYFYDVWQTSPKFNYDPTGTAVPGRFIVRFDCAWSQSCDYARKNVEITLVELA